MEILTYFYSSRISRGALKPIGLSQLAMRSRFEGTIQLPPINQLSLNSNIVGSIALANSIARASSIALVDSLAIKNSRTGNRVTVPIVC
jgi:hypothetical protein